MGTFLNRLQGKLQAQEGVGKCNPKALTSRVLNEAVSMNFGYFGQHITSLKKYYRYILIHHFQGKLQAQ